MSKLYNKQGSDEMFFFYLLLKSKPKLLNPNTF